MKVFYTLEVLQVIKLILNCPVHHLNVAIITPGPNRDSLVLAAKTFNNSLEAVPCAIPPKGAVALEKTVMVFRGSVFFNSQHRISERFADGTLAAGAFPPAPAMFSLAP